MPATRTEKHAAAAPASPHDSASPEPNKPERSRNAKAQARHREKRKAYIDHVRYPDRPKIPILTPLTAPASVDRPSLPVSAAISYLISRHFNTDRPFITAREKRRPAQEPAREHGHLPRRPSQCPDINSARGGHGFQRGAAPCAVRGERAAQARNPQPPRHHRSHVVHKPLLWHRQQGWHYSARNSPPQHRPHPGRLFRNHPSSYPKALRRRGTSLGECLSSLPPFFCALLPLLPLVISRILILIPYSSSPSPPSPRLWGPFDPSFYIYTEQEGGVDASSSSSPFMLSAATSSSHHLSLNIPRSPGASGLGISGIPNHLQGLYAAGPRPGSSPAPGARLGKSPLSASHLVSVRPSQNDDLKR